ncbi:IclR family transcriptional regulator [Enemella sp. A6]|uniref:IclR family transcriptional regulator n=1 Tax=Enemella sp. A6 TaxID=3440152 RepID=UPI003EBAD605
MAVTVEEKRELPPSMVERMTLILDAFSAPGTCLTLEGISRRTGLPRSTAHRILEQLVRVEWLAHSPDGYVLGPRSLRLGSGIRDETMIREAASARLQQLHLRTGLVVHLGVLQGGEVYCLDKIGFRANLDVPTRVGVRLPAHRTALGKAMLAWVEPEVVEGMYGIAVCRSTSGRQGNLHKELSRIRAAGGLAFSTGAPFEHLACVGSAIRGPRGQVGAVSLTGESGLPLERVADLVAHATRRISEELWPDHQVSTRSRRLSVVR